MDEFVSGDFETRSTVDLKKSGVYPYARHKDTDVWCFCYQLPNELDVRTWRPGMPLDPDLVAWIEAGKPFRAWNVNFERVIWNEIMAKRYGWPSLSVEQCYCTAADARAMALPGALGMAAEVLGTTQQKDKEGASLMMRMARPRKVHEDGTLEWWNLPDRVARLIEYCEQDVVTELSIKAKIRPLAERDVFVLDQTINDRGIRFDRELATAAREVAAEAIRRVNRRLSKITGGQIAAVSNAGQFVAWLQSRGVDTDNIAKATVRELKAQDHPEDVLEVLTLREEAGKSSVAKIESMFAAACPEDDRIRGLLLYHGAATGRWSGRLVQPQNFPRGNVSDPERFIPLMLARDVDAIDFEAPVLEVVSSLLRAMLTATPGKKLVAADFSAIEARVLAWLANEQDLLDTFAAGGDVYKVMASKIYRKPVGQITKSERQMGKMAILGLGYGMGAAKFVDACKLMADIEIAPEEAKRVVDLYRGSSQGIVGLWRELEGACLRAVENPGVKVNCAGGRLAFKKTGGFLWLRLPSGRLLCYSNPKLVDKITPWGAEVKAVQVYSVNSVTRKWDKSDLYGGLLAENVVQAAARDILVEAMLRAERAGYEVVLSVHDEVVTEVPEDFGSDKELEAIMSIRPDWADGLPLNAEGWQGFRFRK